MKYRLLVLSRYSRIGASSRLRTLQYRPWLENADFDVEYAPFFDDSYLERLYTGTRRKADLFWYYGKRISQLMQRPKPTLVWIEYESLPWLPWVIERAFLPHHVPVVSDYDDAVFHRYDMHRLGLVRRALGRKIDGVMAASALVMTGNDYLASRAKSAGAVKVSIVPTVIDADVYGPMSATTRTDGARIGWIGTPGTWRDYMAPMMPMLAEVASLHSARLHVVGAGTAAAPHPLLDNLPWSEDTEVARIQEMDLGLMPLDDTPWSRGKCGYKLIQYMGCGLPVIASPVGVNREIVEHGVNGFLADTEAEWHAALAALLADRDLRARMGAAGRKRVEEHYSLQVWGGRVAANLRDVAETHSRKSRR